MQHIKHYIYAHIKSGQDFVNCPEGVSSPPPTQLCDNKILHCQWNVSEKDFHIQCTYNLIWPQMFGLYDL